MLRFGGGPFIFGDCPLFILKELKVLFAIVAFILAVAWSLSLTTLLIFLPCLCCSLDWCRPGFHLLSLGLVFRLEVDCRQVAYFATNVACVVFVRTKFCASVEYRDLWWLSLMMFIFSEAV